MEQALSTSTSILPDDFTQLTDHPDLVAWLAATDEHTLYGLRRSVDGELDRRFVEAMHDSLRESFGWLYGGADPGGLRITAIEIGTTEWDDGHWWDPSCADVVFSDGTRITEDLSDELEEQLTDLASLEQPQAGEGYTLTVPASTAPEERSSPA